MSNEARGKTAEHIFIDDLAFSDNTNRSLLDILNHSSFQTFVLMAIMEVQQTPLRLYCDGVYSELEPEIIDGEREAYLKGEVVGWRKQLLNLETDHDQYTSFALFFKGEELEVTATRVNEHGFLWGMRSDNPLYRELVEPFQDMANPKLRPTE